MSGGPLVVPSPLTLPKEQQGEETPRKMKEMAFAPSDVSDMTTRLAKVVAQKEQEWKEVYTLNMLSLQAALQSMEEKVYSCPSHQRRNCVPKE